MPKKRWQEPIEITAPLSGKQTVHGPFAALIFLLDDWPESRGKAYAEARDSCQLASAGCRPAEQARESFLRAAREAGMQPRRPGIR
jgi:hypothetical protein